jgi:hypothetical protein
MPKSILDKLHATWPDLELSVCVLDRQNARKPAHRQMDFNLLSSSLLHSLTYNVFFDSYRVDKPARSEWPRLTKALVTGGSIRMLVLEGKDDSSYNKGGQILSEHELPAMLQLDITPGTRFPALEELTLRLANHAYSWDTKHCELLRDTMNWSRLRKLDFGGSMPEPFFAAMTGHLPKLQALRFGVPYEERSVDTITRFIDSLRDLEALDIAQAGYVIDKLWPSIMQHKTGLKELLLRPTTGRYYYKQYIDLEYLKTIAAEFPSLERIGWDAPCTSNVSEFDPSTMRNTNGNLDRSRIPPSPKQHAASSPRSLPPHIR